MAVYPALNDLLLPPLRAAPDPAAGPDQRHPGQTGHWDRGRSSGDSRGWPGSWARRGQEAGQAQDERLHSGRIQI